MSKPVWVRRLTDAEGRDLQRIVRRGSGKSDNSVVKWRRALVVLASAGGNDVTVIAGMVQTSPDRVREMIHRFNERGMPSLDPAWAGGRPRRITTTDRELIVSSATAPLGDLRLHRGLLQPPVHPEAPRVPFTSRLRIGVGGSATRAREAGSTRDRRPGHRLRHRLRDHHRHHRGRHLEHPPVRQPATVHRQVASGPRCNWTTGVGSSRSLASREGNPRPCPREYHRSSASAPRLTTCSAPSGSRARCWRRWPASGCGCSCRRPSRPRSPSSWAASATAAASGSGPAGATGTARPRSRRRPGRSRTMLAAALEAEVDA